MKWVSVVLSVPFEGEFTYSVPEKMEGEALFGRRVIVPFGRSKKTAFITKEIYTKPEVDFEIKDIERVVDKEEVFNEDLLDTAIWMKTMYLSPVGVNLSSMIPSGRRESETSSFFSFSSFSPVEKLTDEQEAALSRLRSFPKDIFYLYGVTGSGKSEVFLRRAEDVIKEGKQVLYLVPEITLSHQVSGEVYQRFDKRVAILHSALTPSQRLKAWRSIMKGEVDLIVGARSSVFAPFKNLGLIIMDEEHENAYKSGQSPRYSARQVAQYRAGKWKAQFIMGSATPSLEAWNLIRLQKIKSVVMRNRIGEASFPKMTIVNMRGEKRNISQTLEEEIRIALKEKKGVILFLNRRGYSTFLSCRECGYVVKCPVCGLSLTYHKDENSCTCHYCGYSQKIPSVCPDCGSSYIRYFGHGTEKLQETVEKLMEGCTVDRLDLDTIKAKGELNRKLKAFGRGDTDILIGTQIIAKGLDFRNVGLVGIISADVSLNIPDFRSPERTFQLITQAAGRAGRGDSIGQVVIQTYSPDNYAVKLAAAQDYEAFYHEEMLMRKMLSYPPFSDLYQVVFTSKDSEAARQGALRWHRMLKSVLPAEEGRNVFMPQEAYMSKIKDVYRFSMLIKCPKGKRKIYSGAIKRIREEDRKLTKKDYTAVVDINPYSFS